MTIRVFLSATALTLASAVSAWASCSGHEKQAMSCVDGATWDSATQSCVQTTS